MVKRARALAFVGLLTIACSTPADLSGDLSVAGKSGEVQRGADVEVILLRATDAFEAEWSRAVNAFQAGRARVVAAAREAEGVQAEAQADRATASQSALGLLQSKDEVDWKAYDQANQRQTAALERAIRAGRRGREAQVQLERLMPRHRSDAWDIIRQHQTRAVRTDAAGRFEFGGTAPGRYFLASYFRVAGIDLYWFIPVELKPGVKQVTDLTSGNAGWPFS